jgi:hypothetical protein
MENKFNTVLSDEDKKRLDKETDKLVWIPLKNKVREETAKDIKNMILEFYDDSIDKEEFMNMIIWNIDNEYLYLSDYIKKWVK